MINNMIIQMGDIVCNLNNIEIYKDGKLLPFVQSFDLSTGLVEQIEWELDADGCAQVKYPIKTQILLFDEVKFKRR